MNEGVTKADAINHLCDYYSINKQDIVAFGDNYNDISMFEVADGVAVENAQESLKEVAKYLTKSNEDDGVSYFIQKNL